MADKILLNEIKVSVILSRLCQQLIERHKDFSNVVLVGLQPRGTSLLEQLLKLLKEQGLKSIKSGKLDITFFRDDFRRNDEPLYAKTTEMSDPYDFSIPTENQLHQPTPAIQQPNEVPVMVFDTSH